MHNFLNIIRTPDNIQIQTEASPFRFEEGDKNETDATVSTVVENDTLKIILEPTRDAVKWIKLRFRGNLSDIRSVFEDAFERGTGERSLCWYTPRPEQRMPWYFFATDGSVMHAYGVKTGCNAFCYWQCDRSGITLWLDVRNGNRGFSPQKEYLCAEVISREGKEGETPYFAAREFCGSMCDVPSLPKEPVFGFNNWYWAYGVTSQKEVVSEAENLAEIADGTIHKPYMIMDDGWQINASKCYNGGPWHVSNSRFPSMQKMAEDISLHGCRAGIWFRPLTSLGPCPEEAVYKSPFVKNAVVLDPSHPFTLEKINEDVSRFVDWGYVMIKHDFTTMDLFTGLGETDEGEMFDKEKTNAEIVKNLYKQIQKSARDSLVIGCNTINHLAAGIHPIQRVGGDTSGHCFEWTRRQGIHSMMRMIQNDTFFRVDPDCAAFTEKVSHEMNLEFMEAMAITGATVFASVKPGILNTKEKERIGEIFRIADTLKKEEYAEILDWDRTIIPSEFLFRGKAISYDWYREYDGTRSMLTWLN